MSLPGSGDFSRNLYCLQLQLETLLEGAGGGDSVDFLDSISLLSQAEQGIALRIFSNVITRVLNGERRIMSDQEKDLKQLEDSLYADISAQLENVSGPIKGNLRVLNGGRSKTVRPNALINLNEVRRLRAKPSLVK